MTAAQMPAHCSAWMEMAAGMKNPPRSFVGRIFGKMSKKSDWGEEPTRRNMRTEKCLIMQGERNFVAEQRCLLDWVDRFSAGGADQCTSHAHCFFGHMTPLEWAMTGYKHLDHHPKRFGAADDWLRFMWTCYVCEIGGVGPRR